MKIAVILAYPIEYDSSSMLRCKRIMQGLVDIGNKVTCFCPPSKCCYPSVMENNELTSISVIRYGRELINGKDLITNTNRNKNIRTKIIGFLHKCYKRFDIWGSSIVNVRYKEEVLRKVNNEKCDYLISLSDPLTAHLIGNYCKKKCGDIFYIQQWGDPLALDTISKTCLPVFVRKKIEKHMIRLADKVCYVSPFTLEGQKKLFPKLANKMMFTPTPSLDYKKKETKIQEKKRSISIGYFGGYNSLARNIIPFYNAAVDMKEIHFYIVGDSDLHLVSTENIEIIGRLSKQEVDKYINECDVLVCLMNKKGNQIPGKFYHDASLDKDIMVIKDGEYGEAIELFFKKYNHYTFVENNKERIKAAFHDYIEKGIPIRGDIKEFQNTEIARKLLIRNRC